MAPGRIRLLPTSELFTQGQEHTAGMGDWWGAVMGTVLVCVRESQPQKYWLASPFTPKGSLSPRIPSPDCVFHQDQFLPRPPRLTGHEQAVVVLKGAGQPPAEQHEGHDPLLQERRPPSHASALKEIRNAQSGQPRAPPCHFPHSGEGSADITSFAFILEIHFTNQRLGAPG